MLDRSGTTSTVARYEARESMKVKVRDIAPFGLRLPPELRQALEREADIHNRSLTAEIIERLKRSLEPQHAGRRGTHAAAPEGVYEPASDVERAMVAVFRRLPPEKQLALLSLFK